MARRRIADALSEIDTRLEQQGMPMLTEDEKATIRAKAKDHVSKKKRDELESKYLAEMIRDEEREYVPEDQLESVEIILAPFVASSRFNSAFIALDGVRFYHSMVYSVSRKVGDTMRDIMARGWEHEREIHGERRKADINLRPQLTRITPNGVNSSASMRRGM